MAKINIEKLNEQQQLFINKYIDITISPSLFDSKKYATKEEQAYVEAGYSFGPEKKRGSVKGNAANLRKSLEKYIHEKYKSSISGLSGMAINQLELLASRAESESTRLKAALEILNRAGLSAVSVSEKTVTHKDETTVQEMTDEELQKEIRNRTLSLRDKNVIDFPTAAATEQQQEQEGETKANEQHKQTL